ncbi:hypothetical protein JCM8547_004674 [Rhodosporidiobolus lusitaniae]
MDEQQGDAPMPPSPPRRLSYANSLSHSTRDSGAPPPVPPKPSQSHSTHLDPVQPASFFANTSSSPSSSRTAQTSSHFRPAGSHTARRRSSHAAHPDERDDERRKSGASFETSSVPKAVNVDEGQVTGWEPDPWTPTTEGGSGQPWDGRTWNQQLAASSSSHTSPQFQHVEHVGGQGDSSFAPPPTPPPRNAPLPRLPKSYFYAPPAFLEVMAQPGRWTVPQILAPPENPQGGYGGLWEYSVWDFDLESPARKTPEGEVGTGKAVYRKMGERVEEVREEEEGSKKKPSEEKAEEEKVVDLTQEEPTPAPSAVAAEDTPMSTGSPAASTSALPPPVPPLDAPPLPPKPAKPSRDFSTPSLLELQTLTRPHPHLYFCRSTFSWALFAPLPAESPEYSLFGTDAAPNSSAPELWRAVEIHPTNAEDVLSTRLTSPPLPVPLAPAKPSDFSSAVSSSSLAPWSPSSADGALLELCGSKGSRALISSQGWYPTVIGRELWERMVRKRAEEPPLGVSEVDAGYMAARFVWRALDNLLFAGETRGLPMKGKAFQKWMPSDDVTNDILIATLGFRISAGPDDAPLLSPPVLDERTSDGLENRKRILRAWFEIGCWLEGDAVKWVEGKGEKRYPGQSRVEWRIALERLQEALGGDKLPRLSASLAWNASSSSNIDSKTGIDRNAYDYAYLGVTPDVADEVIEKVYELQVKGDGDKTPFFLEALSRIAHARSSDRLTTKISLEHSCDRHSSSEITAAFKELHLPSPWDAGANYVSEDELVEAFSKRNEMVEHPGRKRVLLEAAKVVGKFRGCEILLALVDSVPVPSEEGMDGMKSVSLVKANMGTVQAYAALGVEEGIDEETLLMVYGVRLDDAAIEADKAKAREALEVIAEDRKSEKLRAALRESGGGAASGGGQGSNDGWQTLVINPDLPIGLTNIANTCYLNSLLQYFFTVRELRETILAFSASSSASPPAEGAALIDLDEAEPKQPIRVGGRIVSESEVKRSKRFVALLQSLYLQLIHSPTSVTPETELAYLALVPSKEEEAFHASNAPPSPSAAEKKKEEEGKKKVEEITLLDSVDDELPRREEEVKSPGGTTVLGKRKNGASSTDLPATASESQEVADQFDDMVIDSQQTQTGSSSSVTLAASPSPVPAGDAEMVDGTTAAVGEGEKEEDGEVEGRNPKRGRSLDPSRKEPGEGGLVTVDSALLAPPLPPRSEEKEKGKEGYGKEKERELEAQVQSYMAFGRQNDVTECMDNVMFQVEAALLASAAMEGKNGVEEEKANLLKRTFYGLTRQTITFSSPSSVPDPVRTQLEPFSSLLVDVPSSSASHPALQRDLYDALDAVFEPQQVELEGQLATRRSALVSGGKKGGRLPVVMQVQLQRVQYDRERGRVFKSNAYLEVPEVLDVGRYVDVQEEEEEGGGEGERRRKREETERLRGELEGKRRRLEDLVGVKVREGKLTSAPSLLRSTLSHFTSLSQSSQSSPPSSATTLPDSLASLLTPDLAAETTAEADALEAEIEALERRIGEIKNEVKALWASKGEGEEEKGTKYELCSVFIHRGTALSGHYYIFQRDSRNPERWLKYNDSLVTEVPKSDVLSDSKGDTNPYFLVYVRQDRLDAIESIKREQ